MSLSTNENRLVVDAMGARSQFDALSKAVDGAVRPRLETSILRQLAPRTRDEYFALIRDLRGAGFSNGNAVALVGLAP